MLVAMGVVTESDIAPLVKRFAVQQQYEFEKHHNIISEGNS